MAQEALTLLCSPAKLDRDRGVHELHKFLVESDAKSVNDLEVSIQRLLGDSQAPWETKHGALMGARTLLVNSTDKSSSDHFAEATKDEALRLLEDDESRVRLAAGEVLGILCKRHGPSIYTALKAKVLTGVQCNLERQLEGDSSIMETEQSEQLAEKLSRDGRGEKRRNSADAEQIFHDTAGWKSLETWMKCLQSMIDGCGSSFNSHIDQELLDLIFQTLTHTNRFVRETGYYVCGSLVNCNCSQEGELLCPPEENEVYRNGHQFAQQLAKGLADNWSQVRLAASVATRQFLMGLPGDEARQEFYTELLPPLCLNRYYVAEGVRIYNQDTWKLVTNRGGKEFVEQYISEVVQFYISQTEADNHAVREAACACIAELGSKINQDVVRPHVAKLLDALLVCFKDESWPVRDASCVACGNFILCFPEESRFMMDDLFPLFYENLQDTIASVRQGGAIALCHVAKAYGHEVLEKLFVKIREGLAGVEGQAECAEKYGAMDKGPATYGVVKRLRDNDMELHTDKQMYSCGSLAPKMHRGRRGGGCMDHQFRRPSEPWELADGCIYLVSELSQLPAAAAEVTKVLPLVVKSVSFKHYTQHVHLLETFCKQLPAIGKGLGKRGFKMYLETYFDPVFYGLTCDNMLTVTAASECVAALSTMIGPGILRGRVEQHNPRFLAFLPPAGVGGPPM